MENSVPEIKNFKPFLTKYLPKNSEVLKYSLRFLTAFGDNYGSTMLAVSAVVQEGKEPPYKLELVAKTPPLNRILRVIFQFERTSIKENAIYLEMYPIIIDLQRELNVPECDKYDVLPWCYGSRISLEEGATSADDDALLILENLKENGYKIGNRLEGFDLVESKVLLRHLAKFHALPIAVRHHKPHLFETKFKPYLDFINVDSKLDEDTKMKMFNSIIKSILDLKEFDSSIDMIKEAFQRNAARQKANYVRQENPHFCTVVHNDYWVNNMMIKYSNDQPEHVKIIDFQITLYGSVAYDIIFFLFTSVKTTILENHFDELLQYYYDQLTSILGNSNVPLENYSYEKFLDEINATARIELVHIMILMRVVFGKSQAMPEKHEDFDDDLLSQDDAVGEEYNRQLRFCINEYVKRGWLL